MADGTHVLHEFRTFARQALAEQLNFDSPVPQEVLSMSLLCLFGRHKPSLHSVTKAHRGYRALCDHCARPLERELEGQWQASEPLDTVTQQAA